MEKTPSKNPVGQNRWRKEHARLAGPHIHDDTLQLIIDFGLNDDGGDEGLRWWGKRNLRRSTLVGSHRLHELLFVAVDVVKVEDAVSPALHFRAPVKT